MVSRREGAREGGRIANEREGKEEKDRMGKRKRKPQHKKKDEKIEKKREHKKCGGEETQLRHLEIKRKDGDRVSRTRWPE
jgi:hypothetical protein